MEEMSLRRVLVVGVVGLMLVGLALSSLFASAGGSVSGTFPDRTFEVTRSHSGKPQSDALTAAITPAESGQWWVIAGAVSGSGVEVEVWRSDAGALTLLSSARLRAAGEASPMTPLAGGLSYLAVFTPYGKAGVSVFYERYDRFSVLWVDEFGTPDADRPGGIAIRALGVYVAGYTYGALPGQTNLGYGDAFLRKYNTVDGTVAWTRQFGSDQTDVAMDVVAEYNAAYVAGATLGALPGQTSAGLGDAFLRKYDSSGNELWTRQFGTSADDSVYKVALDSTGVYAVGTFGDTFRKYSLDGALLWTRTVAGASVIDADPGGVYVAGGSTLRKFSIAGSEQWARPYDPARTPEDLSVNMTGIYLAGSVGDAQGTDAFLTKFDLSGSEVWTRQFGTAVFDAAMSVVGTASAVFVSGVTEGALPGQTSAGGQDAFLRRYDLSGSEVWTRQYGTPESDDASGIDFENDLVVVGYTAGGILGQAPIGSGDVYAARVHP